jgi:2-amino-4-hydroxy-6-hydroxymethyldihydropteridine diphosphokinase
MIYLSLGSNLGDREAQLRMALEKLHQRGIVLVKESSIYETEPVDVPGQTDFLNLVCQVETVLEPESLLAACQEIESKMGRRRGETKGARNIDIDILFYGRRIVEKPFLKIPHPAWRQRNFVLVPLVEIAPDFRDPVSDQTVEVLQQQSCDDSRVTPYIDRLSLQRSS